MKWHLDYQFFTYWSTVLWNEKKKESSILILIFSIKFLRIFSLKWPSCGLKQCTLHTIKKNNHFTLGYNNFSNASLNKFMSGLDFRERNPLKTWLNIYVCQWYILLLGNFLFLFFVFFGLAILFIVVIYIEMCESVQPWKRALNHVSRVQKKSGQPNEKQVKGLMRVRK